jgi:hypothetical protein
LLLRSPTKSQQLSLKTEFPKDFPQNFLTKIDHLEEFRVSAAVWQLVTLITF